MSGALTQITAYGAQNIYLTGDPQITFFKAVYRRHTHFALESVKQTLNGSTDFNGKPSCVVQRNGDLINQCFLEFVLPALSVNSWTPNSGTIATIGYTDAVGHALVKTTELQVGGQRIDKQYGLWFDIWTDLTIPASKEAGYDEMVGRYSSAVSLGSSATASRRYYVPLYFYFNRNYGLSIPLIALQYHEVRLEFELRPFNELVRCEDASGTGLAGVTADAANQTLNGTLELWIDYVYLDTEERRMFAQNSHEYLIEQLQYSGPESVTNMNGTTSTFRLNFNHPVKELVWVLQRGAVVNNNTASSAANEWFNFGSLDTAVAYNNNPTDLLSTALLKVNNHDRFNVRYGSYFRLVQCFQHHTRVPQAFIYVYSFAIRPEDYQPSGSLNMSRIDNCTLHLTTVSNTELIPASSQGYVHIFGTNYNVFRVRSGMGGLADSS